MLLGLLILKLLVTPWTFGSSHSRTVLRDQECQTEPASFFRSVGSQTAGPAVCHHRHGCSPRHASSANQHRLKCCASLPGCVHARCHDCSYATSCGKFACCISLTVTDLRVIPVRTALTSFFIQGPGEAPHSRGVPFEHRCPEDLRIYITNAGDTWHCSHTCSDSRTRNPTRSVRPCRICTSGHCFPVLMQQSQGHRLLLAVFSALVLLLFFTAQRDHGTVHLEHRPFLSNHHLWIFCPENLP